MDPLPLQQYVYRAAFRRVIDGDTIEVELDLGLHDYRVERVRLLGVDCPEMRGPTHDAGMAARLFTVEWLIAANTTEWPLVLRTYKDPDHFGRWLADVWRLSDGAGLGEALLAAGHATAYPR